MERMAYRSFLLTILISFCIMYGVMFLNVDQFDHVYLSVTRLYMALLMVAPMGLLMIGTMRKMYANKKINLIISAISATTFTIALFLLRTQTFVDDRQYMQAMIPHHSSAILTSKHADIQDPEVKKLSQQIIKSQEQEIVEMKAILKRLDK